VLKPRPIPNEVKPLKLSGKFLSKYFKQDQGGEEIEAVIAEALKQYFSNSW
jgi:hypothetical protein